MIILSLNYIGGGMRRRSNFFKKLISFFILNTERLEEHGYNAVNPAHIFAVKTYNFATLFNVLLSLIFYFDVGVNQGAFIISSMKFLDFSQADIQYVNVYPIKIFFLLAAFQSFTISIGCCLYFVFRYGHIIERTEIAWTKMGNAFFSQIVSCLLTSLGVIVFFIGTYLVAIRIVEVSFLSQIPGITFFQVLCVIKGLATMSSSAFQSLIILPPYSLLRLFRHQI